MKKILLPTLVLVCICLVVSGMLALTNAVTADRIAAQEQAALEQAANDVLPNAVTMTPIEKEGILGYYGYDDNGTLLGFALTNSSRGYGGDVTATVGIDLEGNILGITVSAPNETPGLGVNVTKDSFLTQFEGKHTDTSFVLKETVTPVTGASYSSDAVVCAVNMAKEQYEILKGEN